MGIPGSVHLNTDDSYTIFIDAKLNNEKQQEVFWHELHHITNGDFHTLGNINAIESNATTYEKRIFKMNVCTKCKTTYEGAFCPNCGTPANQTPAPTYPTPPQKKVTPP